MKKIFLFFMIFVTAGLLLWAFPFFSVALSAPAQNVDLVIGKYDYPNPVIAGNALTYTLAITNSGDLRATHVALTDILPGEVSFKAASSGCSYDNGTGMVQCSLGNLRSARSTKKSITVQVSPSARGSVTNTASVSSHEPDLIPSTNTAQTTTNVDASADLGIRKSDGISQIMAGSGGTYTYAITLTNAGPSLASGVVVTDTWPVGFTRETVSLSEGICDTTTSSTDFTCDVADIPVGGQQAITVTYSVPPETPLGDYTNIVEADSVDSTGRVTATDTNTVVDPVDLGINKSDRVSQVTAGDGVTYHYAITVTNESSELATGVVVTDTWPAGFTRVDVVPSQGICDELTSPTDFTCDVGDILGGDQETISVAYSVPSGTPAGSNYTNIAEANGTNANAKVTATDTNTVLTASNLDISKSDAVSQVTAGNAMTYHYTIIVTNVGPSVASGVVVTDTWPIGFSRGVVIPTQGTCDELTSPTDFTCDMGDILAGDQESISVAYNVPSGTPAGSYTNLVGADALNAGALITATDTTNVITRANLSLSKLDNPDPVNSGETLTYTLTVNNAGPSDAVGVVISDTLPAGTTFNDALSSLTCDAAGSIVTCNQGVVAKNGSSQAVIRVTVNTTIAGTITNRARVTADTIDPGTGNNLATASTTVDVGKPVVTWIEPVPNDLIYYYVDCLFVCEIVHFRVSAIDDVGVQRVEFYRWDHVIEAYVPIGIDTTSPSYTWDFDTSVLPYGYNQIFAQAYDTSGNPSTRKRIFLVKEAYIFFPLLKR